jgi:hypothetical protein
VLQVNLNVLTRTDESAPLHQRTFHFDGSTKELLHLTGNMPPLLNTLPRDENNNRTVLPQIANFVTVDVQQLAEDVKTPCFFEILGFFARDFDVLDEKLDIVIAKDQLQGQVGSTTARPSVFVLYNRQNHFDSATVFCSRIKSSCISTNRLLNFRTPGPWPSPRTMYIGVVPFSV